MFQFFINWSKPTELTARRKRIKIALFMLLEVMPWILVCLKLIEVQNTEEFVHTLLYIVAYGFQILLTVTLDVMQPAIKQLMREFLRTVFEEDEMAIPFVYVASDRARRVMKYMTVLFVIAINTPLVFFPALFGTLPIPMYLPASIATNNVDFWTFWTYQLIVQNYTLKSYYGVMLAFVQWTLIIGYAKFVSASIRELLSSSFWMNDREELIKCYQSHQRLKK
jgi:hypothetical protein